MAQIPIGLQLYSVREELDQDLRGTLEAVAEMGYSGVEFAGAPKHRPEVLKSLLDELGLVCCGWHTPFNLVQDDMLDETIAFNQALDNRFVIIPGIPPALRRTQGDWIRLADFFNRLSRKLAEYDMFTGYHNHHIEFTHLGDETPWDTFFGQTDQRVIMQLDLGNALLGGANLLDILERYPGRAVTVHLKPYKQVGDDDDPHAGFRPIIGQDDVPWQEVFDLCETSGGTEWYIVEYESDLYPPLEAVDRCLQALREMGK